MEELRLAARAYYNNSSIRTKNCARQFFVSMDANRDGSVSYGEFAHFLRRNGYGRARPETFARFDANGDGRLDFWETMAFYYAVKTRGVWCRSCRAHLPGLYFTCMACFDRAAGDTFDLCARCYGARRFRHPHNLFVDSYVLLRSKRGISPGLNVNLAITRPQPNNYQAGGQMTNPWFRSLEVTINVGNLETSCSIM